MEFRPEDLSLLRLVLNLEGIVCVNEKYRLFLLYSIMYTCHVITFICIYMGLYMYRFH